jgi:hypothetical protein
MSFFFRVSLYKMLKSYYGGVFSGLDFYVFVSTSFSYLSVSIISFFLSLKA